MESSHDREPPDATPPRGLVVQTGRGAGACQPLRAPVTLVGRAAACDVRIDAQAVRALHCLLAPGPEGVSLRALHAGGTRVNGRPATAALLRDGDVLEVGPVQFRVSWPAPSTGDDAPDLEALRIQAAAVVAQQAALNEWELRLEGRDAALARQEEQLAEHLEAKRRQLLELQDQITQARAALRQKRAAHAELAAKQEQELAAARAEADELQRAARAERQRLTTLRRRMIQRWRRHWTAERRAVAAGTAALDQQRELLDEQRGAFNVEVLRFHTHAELEKRRLQEASQALARDMADAQVRHAAAVKERDGQVRDLARRAKAVLAEERRIADQRQRWATELRDRQREFENLETRIGNARWRLLEQQQDALRPEPAPAAPEPLPADLAPVESVGDLPQRESALARRGEVLARVAAELADQRLLLAEQAQRLVKAQEEWFAERAAALTELAELGAQFQEQEQELALREHGLETAEGRYRDARDALVRTRVRLEAELARGAAQLAERRTDLDRRDADLHAREVTLARARANHAELYRRWGQRRTRELEALRAAREATQQERAEWAAARVVCLRSAARTEEERRAVTAQALALEQSRAQHLGAIDRPAAARRLHRLQRRWEAWCAAAARDLNRLRATLAAEGARLDEQARRADDEVWGLERRGDELAELRAELERRQAEAESGQAEWEQRLGRAEARRTRAEQHAAELNAEIERLARFLIDDLPPATQSADRAA